MGWRGQNSSLARQSASQRLELKSRQELASFTSVRDHRRARRVASLTVLALSLVSVFAVTRPARAEGAGAQLPIVKQALRDNCETAALSMLLVTRGVRVDQLVLQRELPRSGPLDPVTAADGSLRWGDPDRGFVGRADGGGTRGGYGVYTAPIKVLAARYGVTLNTLNRRDPSVLYRRIASGLPVLVWVGLSNGPYLRWRSSQGKWIVGNFGEHTVVLTGIRGSSLSVNDPLRGVRTIWSRSAFEMMWARLGRRALGI